MTPRVLIWVQHLLGVGHLARAGTLARAFVRQGIHVTFVSGGVTPSYLVPAGVTFVQLPPVRAKDENFDELVDEQGDDVSAHLMDQRQAQLLQVAHADHFDGVITETFPFGRRLLERELLALLAHLSARPQRSKLVCSIRDILQRPRKTVRAQAMVDRCRAYYDLVLVHGDPSIAPIERSFAEFSQISDLVRYTGYICKPVHAAEKQRRGVLVSTGGGAAGSRLIELALQAFEHSALRDQFWTVVTGPLGHHSHVASHPNIRLVPSLPDLTEHMSRASVHVCQAGYNTLVESVQARTPSVVIPFETEREQEQLLRARLFAEKGFIHTARFSDLTPSSLANLIDTAAMVAPSPSQLLANGAEESVRILQEILRS